MLETAHLVAFLPTARPAESRQFYQRTIGLIFMGEDAHSLIFDCNGTFLRIQKLKTTSPGPQTALGWDVPDIVKEIHDLAAKGVDFVRYTGLQQDRDAIWTAPDGTMVAWFKDPDGNVLSLSERPEVV
jgi:catechol 2,3-dioxygenase-like lactoylglutathione lyase family enzyme